MASSKAALEPEIGAPEVSKSEAAPHQFVPDDHLDQTKAFNEVVQNARAATENEQKMTLLQGIKLYPKAVGWSVLISTCICMEGYDISLINNFCKLNASRRHCEP